MLFDRYLSTTEAYQVNLDDHRGGYIGTSYLIGLGHRNAMLVTGELEQGGVNFHRWRG
jgi:DNA-binding LacI/PurR family transcriptional regulator